MPQILQHGRDSVLLGCDSLYVGNWILLFWGNVVSSFSEVGMSFFRTYQSFNTRMLCCLIMLGFCYPVTHRHIPEEWNPQLYHCKNLKTRILQDNFLCIECFIIRYDMYVQGYCSRMKCSVLTLAQQIMWKWQYARDILNSHRNCEIVLHLMSWILSISQEGHPWPVHVGYEVDRVAPGGASIIPCHYRSTSHSFIYQ